MVISGALTNVFTGFFVNRVSARLLVIVSAIISSISPLLMAIADPRWTYWAVAFPAILLCPINIDGMLFPPFLSEAPSVPHRSNRFPLQITLTDRWP